MEKESTEMIRVGIEAALVTVVLICIIGMTIAGKSWYARERESEYIKLRIAKSADAYFLESGIALSGSDIVEFILKNDALYDYYIQLGPSQNYSITKAVAENLNQNGENGSLLWSQAYLTDIVFKDNIYQTFTSTPERVNGDTIAYRFVMN